jgi:ubiquinone/menaquinone biosynthesis C-methylase UbiE
VRLPDAAFDGVVCFTMLHHVPSALLQYRLLAEVARVLRPGGVFAGTGSRSSRKISRDAPLRHPGGGAGRNFSSSAEDCRI